MGKRLATDLEGGEILALEGELGAGKTTIVQGLAEGLGITSRIISPTFILMRKYGVRGKGKIRDFYHLDLYRFESEIEREVVNLGVTDFWEKPENVIIIEWAEKIKKMIPKSAKWILFESLGEEKRKITVK